MNNEAIAAWVDAHGEPKTEAEKQAWSDSLEAARPYDNEEKKEWFIGICTRTLRVLFFGPPRKLLRHRH